MDVNLHNAEFLRSANQFRIIEDLGEYIGTAKGDNFQDLCVSGDYIINFPLTLFLGIGDYINMYSISRRALVSDSQLDFQFEGVSYDEPEGICELEPGVFAAAVNVGYEDGRRTVCIYKTMVPYDIPMSIMKEEEKPNVQETKGNEKENQTGGSRLLHGTLIWIVVAAIVISGAVFGIYMQILHVRRERARKLRRARRERERIREMLEE